MGVYSITSCNKLNHATYFTRKVFAENSDLAKASDGVTLASFKSINLQINNKITRISHFRRNGVCCPTWGSMLSLVHIYCCINDFYPSYLCRLER